MILLVHIIFGVALASLIKNPYLAILVAYLSHYFLDLFPHIEYPIYNLKRINKNFKKAIPQLIYFLCDITTGFALVYFLTDKSLIFFIYAFFTIIPDGLTIVNALFENKLLKLHDYIHREKIHFLKEKQFGINLRIITQVFVVIISIILITK